MGIVVLPHSQIPYTVSSPLCEISWLGMLGVLQVIKSLLKVPEGELEEGVFFGKSLRFLFEQSQE